MKKGFIFLLAACLILCACGQSGKLYLPDPNAVSEQDQGPDQNQN
ncbi:LPS translocon maturation chaperone LptM [Aquicella lusitana]|uniref:Putative small lipoprotein YifL n=1 Tax=Aquicella lusitana TaxID=254246 RepID=A0A370GSU7_9COXI|nr:lipoprotein [Aquicella lusitana]RDI46529.1 putative small lipoprotein YifL [Aquicella lusitana]VVC74193.1 hypothetical protein AQULUS_19580 [Aquicella lusitana]